MRRKKKLDSVDMQTFYDVYERLQEESDCARVLTVAAWADDVLGVKLRSLFREGNKKARSQLFSPMGPFSSFASKISAAYCLGWLDPDVYNDLEHLRKIRNEFAHEFGRLSLNCERMKKLVEGFQIPHRFFTDWNELRAAEYKGGFVLYKGDKPESSGEELALGKVRFREAVSMLILILLANLGLEIVAADGSSLKFTQADRSAVPRKNGVGDGD